MFGLEHALNSTRADVAQTACSFHVGVGDGPVDDVDDVLVVELVGEAKLESVNNVLSRNSTVMEVLSLRRNDANDGGHFL